MQNPHHQLRARALQAALILALACGSQTALAVPGASRLYAPCVVCHQPNAWGSPDGAIPNLAGQQKRYVEKQLELFRSEVRVDTAMQIVTAHAKFDGHTDIPALAGYLSELNWNPNPVTGTGDHLRVGLELYTHICAACHGANGRGEPANRVPRLAGQHYPYLQRQIEMAANLHKDLAPPEMTSALRGMRPSEKDALADYISRLGNADALLDSNRVDGPGK
jgi:cytochrome c553